MRAFIHHSGTSRTPAGESVLPESKTSLYMHSLQALLLLLLLSRFSRVRLCDPIDGSPPGSPVPGILLARTLDWVTISFSNVWKWKVKVKSLSRVWLCAIPWTAAYQALLSVGFSRQEHWSGVPLPSPGGGRRLFIFIFQVRKSFEHVGPTISLKIWGKTVTTLQKKNK